MKYFKRRISNRRILDMDWFRFSLIFGFSLIFLVVIQPPGIFGKGGNIRPTSRNQKANQKINKQSHQKPAVENKLDSPEASFMFRKATSEEKLLSHLFQDYNSVARAVIDTNKTVEVTIDFVLLRIHGLDERSQVLTTTGLVIAEWTDERLTWDPDGYDNLTSIIIKAEQIWLPELALMNGADELMPDFERIRVLLHHDGRLHWEPGGIFRTTCDIDIAYFPFDSQNCLLLIGAYSYYSTKMNITNASSGISTHEFRISGEWQVHATSSQWNITMLGGPHGDGYSHVVFTLNLRRRFKFYIMNIVLPCVMLSVLIMVGFCLPPDAGEKISLGISVLLAFTVFLLMIADNIPRTSLAIPLIVTYLMVTMTLGTLSVCMTVLVLNLHHRGSKHRPAAWVSTLVLVYLARLVCMEVDVQALSRAIRRRKEKQLICHVSCRFAGGGGDGRESDPEIPDRFGGGGGGSGHHHHHHHHHLKRTNYTSLPLQSFAALQIPQRRRSYRHHQHHHQQQHQQQQQQLQQLQQLQEEQQVNRQPSNHSQGVWMKRMAEEDREDDLVKNAAVENADEAKTSNEERESDDEMNSSSSAPFCFVNLCPLSIDKWLPEIPKLCFKKRQPARGTDQCHDGDHPGNPGHPGHPGRQMCRQTSIDYGVVPDVKRSCRNLETKKWRLSRAVERSTMVAAAAASAAAAAADKSKPSPLTTTTTAQDRDEAANIESEWHEMARVLDRVFFWLIFLMMSASTAVILFYPKYSNLPSED